jgi:hypothetical protein
MDLVRVAFGIVFAALAYVAVVLGMAILCRYETRLIVRLVNELAPAPAAQPDAACRATCDR